MNISGTKVVNSGDMAACTSLTKLTLIRINKEGEPFSLAGVAKMPGLKSITINDSQVANFEALASCTELTSFEMKKTKGVTSLAPLKSLPNLKRVVVSKGAFPEAELGGFAQTVKVEQR